MDSILSHGECIAQKCNLSRISQVLPNLLDDLKYHITALPHSFIVLLSDLGSSNSFVRGKSIEY